MRAYVPVDLGGFQEKLAIRRCKPFRIVQNTVDAPVRRVRAAGVVKARWRRMLVENLAVFYLFYYPVVFAGDSHCG